MDAAWIGCSRQPIRQFFGHCRGLPLPKFGSPFCPRRRHEAAVLQPLVITPGLVLLVKLLSTVNDFYLVSVGELFFFFKQLWSLIGDALLPPSPFVARALEVE